MYTYDLKPNVDIIITGYAEYGQSMNISRPLTMLGPGRLDLPASPHGVNWHTHA